MISFVKKIDFSSSIALSEDATSDKHELECSESSMYSMQRTIKLTRKPGKKVMFTSHDETQEIKYGELSDKDRSSLWYSKRELKAIAYFNRKTVMAYRKSRCSGAPISDNEDDLLCIRGLEHLVSIRTSLQSKARVVAVRQAVLNEQHHQRRQGVWDGSKIRRQSRQASKSSRQAAHDRGINYSMGNDWHIVETPSCTALPILEHRVIQKCPMKLHVDTTTRMIILH